MTLQDIGFLIVPLCIAAYLLGSISSAVLVCKVMGYPDPRTEGSNNPGATNVMRIAGKPAAAITFAGDISKGIVPVLIAYAADATPFVAALVGAAAFLGHLFPVFFRFQGGKGVATAFGLLFVLHWPSGLVAAATWLSVFALNRISSVASLSAFIVAPACLFVWLPGAFWPMLAVSIAMIARHRANLEKLIRGEELGFKSKKG